MPTTNPLIGFQQADPTTVRIAPVSANPLVAPIPVAGMAPPANNGYITPLMREAELRAMPEQLAASNNALLQQINVGAPGAEAGVGAGSGGGLDRLGGTELRLSC